jgi:SpoIVB peptidase S55
MAGWARLTVFVVVLFAAVLASSGSSVAAPPDDGCDTPIMPLSAVTEGMTGTGFTVAQGTEPDTFHVEVLGILQGYPAPGRDVIIVNISGPIVDAAGGVWYGMSGSPIYVGDELIGALAYGFSFGPSTIAGLTPADEMMNVLGYPATSATRTSARIDLPLSMVKTIARETNTSLAEMSDTLVRLRMPVSVSGVSSERMGRVNRLLRRNHARAVPYAGASVGASAVSSFDTLRPGGNFAAALSYGDLTIAGVGTTTYVCDGQAMAFGHPFFAAGRSAFGASGADAITIVTDPVFSPYKLANVEGVVGRVDQDRFAGIRAVDDAPTTIPVTSGVTSLDTGNARAGETDVVFQPEFPYLTFIHMFTNIDTVFDQIGAGSSTISWKITGTRADGSAWQLRRLNLFTSEYDLSIDSTLELWSYLNILKYNPFERIKFTGVEATASVEDTVDEYTLTRVLVCRRGVCRNTDQVSASPGQTIALRAVLTTSDGSATETVDFMLTVPSSARRGGIIEVAGAPDYFDYCLFDEECGTGANVESFDQLLRRLRHQRVNNVLTAQLRLGYRFAVKDWQREVEDRVVRGSKRICVSLGDGSCGDFEGGK